MDDTGECTSPASELITYPNIRMPELPDSQFLNFDVDVSNIEDGNDDTNLRSFFISWSYQAAFPQVDKIELVFTQLSNGRQRTINPRLDQTSITLPNIPEGAMEIKMSVQNNCGSSNYVTKRISTFPSYPPLNFEYVPEGVDPLSGSYACGIYTYWRQPLLQPGSSGILEYQI
jgi:hypothetical protein